MAPVCGCSAVWQPHSGPQHRFITTSATEVLYGGAAGGGKSAGLIAIPLRWLAQKNFLALVLRRDTTQLGDLIAKGRDLYPLLDGKSRSDGASVWWTFPSGARVWFTHCLRADDVARFDGYEISVALFDELTHFEESQYLKIRARIRSPNPAIPAYARSTTNPGGAGHAWVFARWAPWLDPECKVPGLPDRIDESGAKLPPMPSGAVLHYIRDGETDLWVPKGTLDADGNKAQGRTFIAARLDDNPSIDSSYKATLNDLDRVRRAQLKDGNWLVSYSSGSLFQRHWFDIVEAAPAEIVARIRYWDRAATEPHATNKDPDWTRGLKLAKARGGLWYVEDVASIRARPFAVSALIRQTAILDGPDCRIGIEQDPGQAGVAEAEDYVRLLAGFHVSTPRPTGDKVTRAGPVSAQAEAKNIKLVKGHWNRAFLDELEVFPTPGIHDDQVDALSGGFNSLAEPSDAERLAAMLSGMRR